MSAAMSTATPSIALFAPVAVTADTLKDATRDLPAFVRAAFGYAVKISHGSLIAQLPDGRRYRFEGTETGPERRSSSTTSASVAGCWKAATSASPRPTSPGNGIRPT